MTTTTQPTLSDWGRALCDTTFCVVDLETTGSTGEDCITEIGAVKVCAGEVVGEFQTLVNPRTAISPLVAVLTGITNQMVATAPRLEAVLGSFLEFLGDAVLVAHNAPFDTGFLKRACENLGHPWPRPTVVDTAALARVILLRDEVRNCKLATLAAYFHATTEPNHRALADARATVDVLHGLMERVGNRGVYTVEDLVEFTRKVSPQRRAKRSLANDLPAKPGVYWFVADEPDARHGERVLYVGKSVNLRNRVRSYFTAAETRRRMDEMVRLSSRVDHVVCTTALQAEVCELRLIATHAPAYNRRSKYPQRQTWLKVTQETFPRLSVVRSVRDDGATYFGPFRSRDAVDRVMAVLHDAFPIRRCTPRISRTASGSPCALAGMGRCVSPCDGSIEVEAYHKLVEELRATLTTDIRPAITSVQQRLQRLIQQQRFEEADDIRQRLQTMVDTARRNHRVASLARVPHLVAAIHSLQGWEIHVIRYGRLAQAALARPGEIPQAVARAAVATAEDVTPQPPPLPSCTIEETERIADWLERPGVRIMEIDGDWIWPLHGTINSDDLATLALGRQPTHAQAS